MVPILALGLKPVGDLVPGKFGTTDLLKPLIMVDLLLVDCFLISDRLILFNFIDK